MKVRKIYTQLILTMVTFLLFGWGSLAAAGIDLTGPVITEPFPVGLINDPTPSFGAIVSDDSGIAAGVSLVSVDGGPPVSGLVYDQATGVISTEWPIPLIDGMHSVLLEVKDTQGNVSNSSWNFTLDATPPLITQGAPVEGTVQVMTTNSLPSYYFYVTDNNRVTEAKFYLNDILQNNCILRDWGATQLAYTTGNPVYPDGVVTARLELKDAAGNTTIRNWKISVEGRPLVSSLSPNGTTTSYTPTIQAYIRDQVGVDTSNMLLSIDGGSEINVAPYYNRVTKYLNYPVTTPFSPEKHTITLKARCINGHETVTTWNFWYDLELPKVSKVILQNYPAQGKQFEVQEAAVLPRGKDLSFQFITSEQLYLFEMTLDGLPIQANGSYIYWSRLYNTVWALNTTTLPDGPHKFTVRMVDAGLNEGTYSLNFTISESPAISDEKPVNLAKVPIPKYDNLNYYRENTDRRFEAILTDPKPVISMKITDGNDTLTPGDITFKLDGVEKPFAYDQSTGMLTYNPPEKLEDETVHTINVIARDKAGNNTNAEWKFYINTYPRMTWDTDKTCLTCHAESGKLHFPATPEGTAQYPTNCKNCHGVYVAQTMDQRCINCHRDYWHITVYPQGTFHEVSHGDQTGIPTVMLDTAHRAETGSCSPCHAKSINREHARPDRTTATGGLITCSTCHLSSDNNVQQAIATGNSNCGGCHGSNGDGHEAVHTSGLDANCTAVCHKASLTQEHLNNPKTQIKALNCDTCHSSAKPVVAAAIANNRIQCAACHLDAHNVYLALPIDGDIPLFPGLKWTTPILGSIWGDEVPADFNNGYVVISSSAGTLTGEAVLAYYKNNMVVQGWAQVSSDPVDLVKYDLTFEKAGRKSLIRFVQVPGKEGPVSRVIMMYK